MSRFGDDSFRACQFEATDGVSTLYNEDSIHQYSRAQIERQTKARQKIDQEEADDETYSDVERIEATISEDLADGQSTLLDAFLKLLSEGEHQLLVPSDVLDDHEIRMIETESEEIKIQERIQRSVLDSRRFSQFIKALENKAKATKAALRFRELYDKGLIKQEHPQTSLDKKTFRAYNEEQGGSRMPPKYQDFNNGGVTKKRKRSNQPQKHSADLEKSKNIDTGSMSIADQEGLIEKLGPHLDLLYMISCKYQGDQAASHHPVPAFRDSPIPGGLRYAEESGHGLSSHLNGAVPVLDLESFMADDSDDIAFVVVRTVECSEASILMARAGVPLRWTEDIYAKSSVSKNALQQIATCYFHPLRTERSLYTLEESELSPAERFKQNRIAPFDLFFYHHRHLFEEYVVNHPGTKQHINALLSNVGNAHSADFTEADGLFARGLVSQAHVLKLFKPNELVVSSEHGRPAAFVVQEWPTLRDDNWVKIVCWSFQTDGSGFTRKRSILSIPPTEPKSVAIQTLPTYPFRFANQEIRESIQSNGEKQWELRIATQVTYAGWNVRRDQYYPDARFMIDHGIYRKMHERALAFKFDKPKLTHSFDRLPAYLKIEQKPSDISILLLPPHIHGFYLNEKKWVHLFVNCIHPVSWNKTAYERLVLPPQTKDLVRALVTVRTSQRGVKQGIGVAGKRIDITTGKGNGLIMLLHGGPGTGKTLTAESVAEIAEMPLYRVTCGDVGTSAEAVEKYLSTVLHLGKIWNCVLLLDEADVFLEERSMSDLKRNSLVSVFLRILEYYDGILILTSNRVGIFDEAFKSRIQVSLHYENLNRSSRKKIWQNFIDMLEEDEENVNFDEIKFHLDDLAGKDLNGRQIRNVLTTARQLAIYKDERLEWEHLAQALSVSSDFSAYLKRMQGHSDDQRARDIGLR